MSQIALTTRPAAKGLPLLASLAAWRARRRTRLALSRLDAHLLDDIGLKAQDVRREIQKPFWTL